MGRAHDATPMTSGVAGGRTRCVCRRFKCVCVFKSAQPQPTRQVLTLKLSSDFESMASVSAPVAINRQGVRERQKFLFASGPETGMARAVELTKFYRGRYAAGDKDDTFNTATLQAADAAFSDSRKNATDRTLRWEPPYAPWQCGWQGKVTAMFNVLREDFEDQDIPVISVKGGPASDWERKELEENFAQNLAPHFKVILMKDYGEFERWLQRKFA